jgi:hypothetical protein
MFLGLWKAVMNLQLAGLNLFHQPVVMGLARHYVGTIVGEGTIPAIYF